MRNLKFILGMLVMVFSLTSCESNDIALSYEDDNLEENCVPFNENILGDEFFESNVLEVTFEYHKNKNGRDDVLLVYNGYTSEPVEICNDENSIFFKEHEVSNSSKLVFEVKSNTHDINISNIKGFDFSTEYAYVQPNNLLVIDVSDFNGGYLTSGSDEYNVLTFVLTFP